MRWMCPAKEIWLYSVGDGEPLKDLKEARDVVKAARRKQKYQQDAVLMYDST